MKARLPLQPGQEGTKKLVEKYGDQLLYVRYRYDAIRKRRVKTVELIEEEVPWLPGHGRLSRTTRGDIHVAADERGIQRQIRQAGGTWDAHQKVWHVTYETVVKLGLEERIVVPEHADGSHDG